MSDDVVIGYDGRARCAWAGAGDTANSHYHDEVWGTRTYDEPAMFEALTLGVFDIPKPGEIAAQRHNCRYRHRCREFMLNSCESMW
jgi:Methyladenine glycosylase